MLIALGLTLISITMGGLFLSRARPEWLTQQVLALVRRVIGMRTRYITIDGLQIAYLDGGRGEPLLLLHGIGADKDNFLLVAAALRRHYRVVVPDLPGFGDSSCPEHLDYRVADQVARLRQFCSKLGISRCHLGGNSMGGLIAGAYAATHPQDVLSLWLLAPAGVKAAKPSPLMQAIADGQPLPILARNVDELRALMRFVMQRPPPVPGFMLRALAQRQAAHFDLNQRIVKDLVEGPWLDELLAAQAVAPALIVWGDADRALDVSGARVLSALIPRSQVTILAGIGHVPMMEAPRRVVRDYLDFRASLAPHAAGSPTST